MRERQTLVRKDINWLRSTVKTGKLLNVYLLVGEDVESIDEAISVLKKTALEGESAELNFKSLNGDETEASDLILEACTAPFLAKRRLVLVKEVQKMHRPEIEKIIPICKVPASTCCLILTAPKADGLKALLEAVDKGGAVVYLEAPRGRALASRIMRKAEEAKIKISEKAVSKFLELAGDDIGVISSEWMKVAAYSLDKGDIGVDEIEKIVGDRREANVFALTDAIAARNFRSAAEVLAKLLAGGEDWTRILAVIAWQFRTMWRAKNYSAKSLELDAISVRLGLSPKRTTIIVENVARFTESQLLGIFYKILETDLKLKTTGVDKAAALELMLLDLCREAPALSLRERA